MKGSTIRHKMEMLKIRLNGIKTRFIIWQCEMVRRRAVRIIKKM